MYLYRFSDIQQKAMMGLNIVPSVFLENAGTVQPNRIANQFEYFLEDLPFRGAFDAELLQWLVSSYRLKFQLNSLY